MRHAGTQEIETERLILRRLTPEDAGMMYTNWANDPQVTKYLRWEPHKNAEETRELLTAWALLYPNGDYYEWGIVEKATGQVFGTIGTLFFTHDDGCTLRGQLAGSLLYMFENILERISFHSRIVFMLFDTPAKVLLFFGIA